MRVASASAGQVQGTILSDWTFQIPIMYPEYGETKGLPAQPASESLVAADGRGVVEVQPCSDGTPRCVSAALPAAAFFLTPKSSHPACRHPEQPRQRGGRASREYTQQLWPPQNTQSKAYHRIISIAQGRKGAMLTAVRGLGGPLGGVPRRHALVNSAWEGLWHGPGPPLTPTNYLGVVLQEPNSHRPGNDESSSFFP